MAIVASGTGGDEKVDGPYRGRNGPCMGYSGDVPGPVADGVA